MLPSDRSPELGALYQELLLDHYRRPRNRGTLENPNASVAVRNPLCGDEIELQLALDEEGGVREARFRGQGCAISQASASMMTQLVRGKSAEEIGALVARVDAMLHGDKTAASDAALGDMRALSGVARIPIRVKCALLPWGALGRAIGRGE